jgi:glycosyltransferase involved in cell wall biosynthesis
VKVSLVATVKDAAPHIGEFLASVAAQTHAPDEVVVVDGGSADGTREILEASGVVTVIEETGANIARGRNVAIRAAAHDVLAVTDADCVLIPQWLERLLEPIENGADVAMGFYRPLGVSLLQVCAGAVLPDPEEVREDRFMPSARSVAFVREAYVAAGGYPEWLDVGEDMYLNHRWRELGVRMALAPEAIVEWRIRPSLAETWRQYVGYAKGDALGRMYPQRHALRFSVYGGAAAVLTSRRTIPTALAAAAGVAYAGRPALRAARRAGGGLRSVAAVALTPPMLVFIDVAKMVGYASGLVGRPRVR